MNIGDIFILNRPTLCIYVVDGERTAVLMPANAAVRILRKMDRLVNCGWEDKEVMVFAVDILERGELLRAATNGQA